MPAVISSASKKRQFVNEMDFFSIVLLRRFSITNKVDGSYALDLNRRCEQANEQIDRVAVQVQMYSM